MIFQKWPLHLVNLTKLNFYDFHNGNILMELVKRYFSRPLNRKILSALDIVALPDFFLVLHFLMKK